MSIGSIGPAISFWVKTLVYFTVFIIPFYVMRKPLLKLARRILKKKAKSPPINEPAYVC